MSRGLKILARELKVPVIALSQLSRAPEQRTGKDKRPILSDLRESGNLEQDADLVCFIYREDYYKNWDESVDEPRRRPGCRGIAELIVRKNRNGPIDTVKLAFSEQVRRVPQPLARRPAAIGGARRPTTAPTTGRRRPRRRGGRVSGRVERLPASCPFGNCDGSGWIIDDDETARGCECRERRITQARMAGVKRTLPRKYEGVGVRAPADLRHGALAGVADRRRDRPRVHRRARRQHPGRARPLARPGDVGTGKTSLAMLVSKSALQQGYSAAVYSLPELLTRIRRTYDDGVRRPLLLRVLPPPDLGRPPPHRRPRRLAAERLGARAAVRDRRPPLLGATVDDRHHRPRPRAS